MHKEVRGSLNVAANQKYAIVAAEFNKLITSLLAAAAVDALQRHGAAEGQILQVWVPGSLELATAARPLAQCGSFAAIICLGCIIRGQTDHYDHVAGQAAAQIAAIGPQTGVPVLFGVITADTTEQAMDRAGLKMGNVGWNAACSAIEMADTMAVLKKICKAEGSTL